MRVDLDAPEHALCSETIAQLQAELKWERQLAKQTRAPVGTSINPTEEARPDAWLGSSPRERLISSNPIPMGPNGPGCDCATYAGTYSPRCQVHGRPNETWHLLQDLRPMGPDGTLVDAWAVVGPWRRSPDEARADRGPNTKESEP